ncbi:MAG TPA: type I DNA topoisomerase [Candidatus Paceibacterota bacterium]|nr:type I DNA topoisomerase [Candidatus Paceibacterota bacterium]
MKLLIVESPSKAKTIEKYLDGAYTVRASIGHIRDLPKSNKKAIDIPAGFVPTYEISKGKEKIVHELRHEAEKASEILLAPDPDREGEAIAWHLEALLSNDKNITAPIKRVTFNEITKEAVIEALQHPRDIDQDLRRAQEARRVLDRLVGYDLSGIIWKKVRYGLSAGRVQSPALRILVERERDIRAFAPETYWTLSGLFKTEAGEAITLTCTEEPRDKKEVERILAIGNKESWSVVEVKESEQKRSPRAPFTTSTLQQAASTRLAFSPSRTMQVAQKLYEAGHITYMRTDSTNLAGSAIKSIASVVEKQYGKEYLAVRQFKTKSKNAQEAHEAIRPTHQEKISAGNTDDQKKLYRLIWERTVASQMTDAKLLKTRIAANVASKSIPDFAANGSRVLFPGWLIADPAARGEDIELPKLKADDPLTLLTLSDVEKQTEPPNRYSEAGLIKELEARGIGRPSTYASIMSTLEQRGYVEKINRSLKPTDTGEVVSTFLEQNFMDYISDTFTADMENKLDDIANGDAEYVKTLKDFYGPFQKEVKEKDKLDKATTLEKADPKFKCPKCGSLMVVKLGRGGKFLSCERYPDCDGALTLEGLEIKADEPIGTDPETGLPIFVKVGRFGPYVQLGRQAPKKTKSKTRKSESLSSVRSLSEAKPSSAGHEKIDSDLGAGYVGKPKMASIPKDIDPTTVTVDMALKYLSIPRILGVHPDTGKGVTAAVGRFGPFVAHDGNFRSIKPPLDVYTITLDQALELLAQEKKARGFQRKKKTE